MTPQYLHLNHLTIYKSWQSIIQIENFSRTPLITLNNKPDLVRTLRIPGFFAGALLNICVLRIDTGQHLSK